MPPPKDKVECPECGEKFKGIDTHWYKSSCNYPPISQHQKEVIIGLLMGDDSRRGCNARWTVDESKELFDYMGDPLPGFEYKWPNYNLNNEVK